MTTRTAIVSLVLVALMGVIGGVFGLTLGYRIGAEDVAECSLYLLGDNPDGRSDCNTLEAVTGVEVHGNDRG